MATKRMQNVLHASLPWIGLLGLWAAITEGGMVDPLFLSSPSATLTALFHGIASGDLVIAFVATMGRAYGGFLVAAAVGVPIGLVLGGVPRVNMIFGGLVDALRSMPATALFPAFLLLFGVGEKAKVSVATYVCVWAITIYTAYGVKNSGETRRFLLRLHGASPWQRFIDGLLFPALPSVVGGMRTAVSLSLVVTIGTEMLVGTQTGLGQAIYVAQVTYRIPVMYAAIVLSAVGGLASNAAFRWLSRRVVHWERLP